MQYLAASYRQAGEAAKAETLEKEIAATNAATKPAHN
jgi:hypothetical protein